MSLAPGPATVCFEVDSQFQRTPILRPRISVVLPEMNFNTPDLLTGLEVVSKSSQVFPDVVGLHRAFGIRGPDFYSETTNITSECALLVYNEGREP